MLRTQPRGTDLSMRASTWLLPNSQGRPWLLGVSGCVCSKVGCLRERHPGISPRVEPDSVVVDIILLPFLAVSTTIIVLPNSSL